MSRELNETECVLQGGDIYFVINPCFHTLESPYHKLSLLYAYLTIIRRARISILVKSGRSIILSQCFFYIPKLQMILLASLTTFHNFL